MTLCNELEVHDRLGGPNAAETMARDRAGGAFDPDLVAAFCADRDAVLAVLEPPGRWESWLAAEPGAVHHLDDAQAREAARAIGDFGDLKSRFFAGHSTTVAQLADDAAERAGLDKNQRRALHLAGLLHDLGRVAVTTAIWDKPGMLNDSEWEKVRLHPYYSERCLVRAASLANVATIAGKHHERLDGSGYHRGDSRHGLTKEDRILAASDAFVAMRAARPHRPPLDLDMAGRELRLMAARDLLDADAVNCVLAAAGDTRAPVRRTWPAGLTDREVDVLREIASGSSIQQAAQALQVSAKTVDFHLQNVYAKAGITTRAAAALFAVQHDLLNA
jgi:DNA-binding CsgD family transcriptional regulator